MISFHPKLQVYPDFTNDKFLTKSMCNKYSTFTNAKAIVNGMNRNEKL